MAIDTSVTHTIFFIAAVVVAGGLASAFVGITCSISEDVEERGNAVSDQLLTDIEIINDPRMVPYQDSVLTIYVKNVGRNPVDTSDLCVLVDGRMVECNCTMDGSCPISEVMEIEAVVSLEQGDHVMKVIVSSGTSDDIQFRI